MSSEYINFPFRAQGEARSAELIGDAIKKSRSYVQLRQIENARSIAQILAEAGGKNKLYLDTDGLGFTSLLGEPLSMKK